MNLIELFNKENIFPVKKENIPNIGDAYVFYVNGNQYIVNKNGWELNFAIKKEGERYFSTGPTNIDENQYKILNTVLYCMIDIIKETHMAYYFEGHGKLAKLYSSMFSKLKNEIIDLGYVGVVAPRGPYTQFLFIPKDEFDYEEWKDDTIYGWEQEMVNEKGYQLSGSIVYGIYLKQGTDWKLFDTLDNNDINKIIKYSNILSTSKNSDVVVIEYNAPSDVPDILDSIDNKNVVYSNIKQTEKYDENYLKNLIPSATKQYKMSYTVNEVKTLLTDIFKEEKKQVIKECNKDDDFINITLLLQHNKLIENTNILMDYAYNKYNDEYIAEEIINIIEEFTGMDLNSYTDLIREKDSKVYSKSAHDWVKSQVDKLYPKHIDNKDEAFGIAWDQWKNKHDK